MTTHSRKPALGATLVGLALVAASPARGDSRWEVGGFVGAHLFSSDNNFGRSRDQQPDQFALHHSWMLGLRLGYFFVPRLGVEAEVGLVPTSTRSDTDANVLVYRAHLVVNVLTGRVRPFVLAGGGGASLLSSNPAVVYSDNDAMFHVGAGLKVDVDKARHWGLRLDGRMILPPSTQYWPNQTGDKVPSKMVTEDWEVTLGLYGLFPFAPPPPPVADTDKDGIADDKDKCVAEAGPAENDGCPDKDKDGDGFVDRLDKCPAEAGVKELGGCPDRDGDGDGIVDRLDKCADKAGVAEMEGCPDPDDDGDGVVDRLDKCADKAGPKENGGCPDTDQDGDGVVDRLDECRDKAGPVENDGCPIPEKLKKFTGAIRGIEFGSGSAVILKKSYGVLDKAVAVLKEFADERVEISGHTDDKGDRDVNVKLSHDRAEAVKAYLVGKSIAADRLVAEGYGPDKPVADNKSSAGRAKNRRVEFHLIPSAKGGAAPVAPKPAK